MFEKDCDQNNNVLKYKTQFVAISEKIHDVTKSMNIMREKTEGYEHELRENKQLIESIESKNK